MNVFVLCTGRSGSVSFIEACNHITNYSSSHESRWGQTSSDRFAFPANHIEADNRLSWMLGRLDRAYGDKAFYVHLRRNDQATAQSFARRYGYGIIEAYRASILWNTSRNHDPMDICLDYCDTVNSNIELFLKDKTNTMQFSLENALVDFRTFWERIEAEGDFEAALRVWETPMNTSRVGGIKRIFSKRARA